MADVYYPEKTTSGGSSIFAYVSWWFPKWAYADGGAIGGTANRVGANVGAGLRFNVTGPCTVTVHTVDFADANPADFEWAWITEADYLSLGGWAAPPEDNGTATSGDALEIDVTESGLIYVQLSTSGVTQPLASPKFGFDGVTISDAATPPPEPEPPEPGVVIDPTAADPIPIGDDIISWRITRGAAPEITGGAQPGTLTLVVKNTQNTAGEDAYNPENGSSPLIDYLRDGTALWVGVNSDGKLSGSDPRGLFGGRITDITPLPSPGATVPPTVEFMAEDALGWMGRTPVLIDHAPGRSQGELRALVLEAAGETSTILDNEILTIPLSAADGDALGILDEINRSNGTRHYVKPADASTDWYLYVARNRQWRLDAVEDYSVSQEDDHVTASGGWRLSADTVINRQRATVTPVKFTPSTFDVWTAETLPLIVTTARPFDVWVDFDDYVMTPVVNASYSGTAPTITLTAFGTRAHLTITVSGTTTFAHLTIQGALARRLPNQSWVEDDLVSQVLPRGVRSGSDITSEYVGTLSTARGIAQHVVWRYAQPQVRPTVTIENWFPEMFEIQMYDLIAYTSPQIGVTDRLFEVVGQTHEGNLAAEGAQHHTLTLVLQECFIQADPGWFVLDTSELDDTDILAY